MPIDFPAYKFELHATVSSELQSWVAVTTTCKFISLMIPIVSSP
jgi:hypothetical protein